MGETAEYSEDLSLHSLVLQCALIGLAFYLWSSPVVQPVKVMAVLFHEMSHGLVALMTGGEVLSITVTADEGGACETRGGHEILIVSAGYLGSMFFGGLLLYLSKFRACVPVVYTLLTLTLAGAIFTVLHDPYSRTFATALAASFILVGLLAPVLLGSLFLRVLGTVSCLYSMLDIYGDILEDRPGSEADHDAAAFSAMTGIPVTAVGFLWLAVSVAFFFWTLRALLRARLAPAPARKRRR
jgi:hypothetical protein